MDNKLIYIPDDDKQNQPFFGFKLSVEKLGTHYQNPTQILVQTNKKTLGTSVIYSPMSPPSLNINS